jgi:predicted XRE-type DNA-binding protein
MKLRSNLPNLVREYIQRTKIEQKVLAEKVGIDPSLLSRLLRSDGSKLDMDLATKFQDEIGFEESQLIRKVNE